MDMKVKDLKSIVNYCGIEDAHRIMVEVKYADGTKEDCYVTSFDQYSDCLKLTVNSDVKPSKEEE